SIAVWSAPPPARTPSWVASMPKVVSGAAAAGVANVAAGTAPVSAETAMRRRRLSSMVRLRRCFGAGHFKCRGTDFARISCRGGTKGRAICPIRGTPGHAAERLKSETQRGRDLFDRQRWRQAALGDRGLDLRQPRAQARVGVELGEHPLLEHRPH